MTNGQRRLKSDVVSALHLLSEARQDDLEVKDGLPAVKSLVGRIAENQEED